MSDQKNHSDQDAEQLRSLGYESKFERSMGPWENFSLGFTYLSPVVGVYSVFGMALHAGGPPMFWNYFLIGLGQMLVCLTFGEIVSQYPIAGGLYPWTLRLVGKRYAWMSGWVYSWALFTTVAAVAIGGAPFLARLFGHAEVSNSTGIWIAVAMILFTTAINVRGTKLLARVAMFGFICELVGAIAVGGYLLIFARQQPLSILFDSVSFGSGVDYLPAFLTSSIAAMFCYYGFEACGDVAEEIPNPGIAVPKAMRMTIYVGGGAAAFICLALILAVPDMGAVVNGQIADPVGATLTSALGTTGFRVVIGIVMVSFISCLMSLQAAASRLLFAFGRDGMIVGGNFLSKISPRTKVPINALMITGLIPIAIASMGHWLQDAVATIISFASVGVYVSFQMVVLASLIARSRGWKPSGLFTLGRWGWAVNGVALVFGVTAISNMVWPRAPHEPWYVNYAMLFSTAIVFVSGMIYMIIVKPEPRSQTGS